MNLKSNNIQSYYVSDVKITCRRVHGLKFGGIYLESITNRVRYDILNIRCVRLYEYKMCIDYYYQ